MAKKTRYLDVERYRSYDSDEVSCCVCGDEIEDGDEVVWEPAEHIHPRAVELAHPACSVSNGFRLRYPDEAR